MQNIVNFKFHKRWNLNQILCKEKVREIGHHNHHKCYIFGHTLWLILFPNELDNEIYWLIILKITVYSKLVYLNWNGFINLT